MTTDEPNKIENSSEDEHSIVKFIDTIEKFSFQIEKVSSKDYNIDQESLIRLYNLFQSLDMADQLKIKICSPK